MNSIESFNGGGKSAAELDLAYNQYPDFITPGNPAEGATGITFPLTITWPAVAADAIYIDIRVNGLSAGNGLRGEETSFVLEDWLYMPGETYTVSLIAQRNLDGGINADNQVQSVTVLTFTASGEKGTQDKSVGNSSRQGHAGTSADDIGVWGTQYLSHLRVTHAVWPRVSA